MCVGPRRINAHAENQTENSRYKRTLCYANDNPTVDCRENFKQKSSTNGRSVALIADAASLGDDLNVQQNQQKVLPLI